MDYLDTLVTFGTQNTGPRQVKEKNHSTTQHNTTQYRKLNKLATWTHPQSEGDTWCSVSSSRLLPDTRYVTCIILFQFYWYVNYAITDLFNFYNFFLRIHTPSLCYSCSISNLTMGNLIGLLKTPKVCILSPSYNTRTSTIMFEEVPGKITLTLEQWMESSFVFWWFHVQCVALEMIHITQICANWIVKSTIDCYFKHHHFNETSSIIHHQYQWWTQKEITFC